MAITQIQTIGVPPKDYVALKELATRERRKICQTAGILICWALKQLKENDELSISVMAEQLEK